MTSVSMRLVNTAAEPKSFAWPESRWCSWPTRSTTFSMPVFKSSTISTSRHEPISSERSTAVRPSQKAARHEHDAEQRLLAESGFVAPRGAKAREREEGGVDDAAQPRVAGFAHAK